MISSGLSKIQNTTLGLHIWGIHAWICALTDFVSVVAQLDNLISSDRPTAAVSSTDCVTVHTEWTIPADAKKTQNKRYWGNWMKPFVPPVQTGRLDEGSGGRGRSYRPSGIFPGWEQIIYINICKYAPAKFALNSLSKWVKDSLDSFE